MSVVGYLLSGTNFKKAKKTTVAARKATGEQADQLFQQAYDGFAGISESFSRYSDALYHWGFALMHQAMTKPSEQAIGLYEEALTKFSFCKTVAPNHLGAAVDGGVALLGLAKCKQVDLNDDLYTKAKESFEAAEKIQLASASYNLACVYALQNDADNCLLFLENARDHGLLPSEEDMTNDDDLQNVKQLPWFSEFMASVAALEEDDDDEDEEEIEVEEEIKGDKKSKKK